MSSSSSQSRKRPAPQPVQHDAGGSVSGGSSRTSSQRVRKRKAVSRAFDGLAIHVVDDKLTSEEMTAFWHLIESHCGRVVGRETADVIATKLHRPARIAAHLPEPLDSRVVVRTDWITDSALAGERRPYEPYLLPTGTARPQTLVALPSTAGAMAPPPKPSLIKRTAATSATAIEPPAWTNEKWACQRWAPLVCPNQRLVDELRVIKEQRNLTSASRDDKSSFIAYGRTIASIKAYPREFTLPLPKEPIAHIGAKTKKKIEEFLKTGVIEEAEQIKRDPRIAALREMTKVYGIGPATARELYDGKKTGTPCRSIADIKAQNAADTTYADDFLEKMPREEVEEIAREVNRHMQIVAPGAIHQIVGGYRRGKPASNDMDILFTRPDGESTSGILDEVVDRLKKAGLLVDIISLMRSDSRRTDDMAHFHSSSFDPLDKMFGVYRSPKNDTTRQRDIHRRVDIIIAPHKYYWTAVLGWSGSTQFERDLRLAANAKGYKFDSGGVTQLHDQKEVLVKSEEEIFELFDLRYIPPEWRNAD